MYQFVIVPFIKFNWQNINLLFCHEKISVAFVFKSNTPTKGMNRLGEKSFFSQVIINSLFLPFLEMETSYADLLMGRCHITGHNLYTNCYMYIIMLSDRFYLFCRFNGEEKETEGGVRSWNSEREPPLSFSYPRLQKTLRILFVQQNPHKSWLVHLYQI